MELSSLVLVKEALNCNHTRLFLSSVEWLGPENGDTVKLCDLSCHQRLKIFFFFVCPISFKPEELHVNMWITDGFFFPINKIRRILLHVDTELKCYQMWMHTKNREPGLRSKSRFEYSPCWPQEQVHQKSQSWPELLPAAANVLSALISISYNITLIFRQSPTCRTSKLPGWSSIYPV